MTIHTNKEAADKEVADYTPTVENGSSLQMVSYKVTDPDTKAVTYHTGVIGLPTIEAVILTLQGDDAPAVELLTKAIEQGLGGMIRNHAVNGRGFAQSLSELLEFNAQAGGNRGQALADRRDAINAFVAYLESVGKSVKALQIGKAMLSNLGGIMIASALHKERLLANLTAFAETQPELSAGAASYIAKAVEACDSATDDGDDDF